MSSSDLTAGRICHGPVLTCAGDIPIVEAARKIRAARCSSIVIMADGKPAGIWTERDALAVRPGDHEALHRPVGEVMSSPVKTIPASLCLGEATVRFFEEGVRHFLVHDDADDTLIIGILSQTDVVLNQGIEYFLHLRAIGSVVGGRHVTVDAAMRLSAVVDIMRQSRQDAVAVHYDDGEFGILTERDVVGLIAKMADDMVVGECATRPLITVAIGDSLYTARNLFAGHGIRHLGVTDDAGDLVSMVSFTDILNSIELNYVHELQATLSEREEALALSRGKLRLAGMLFETTREPILITDGNRRIQAANPACRKLTGFDEHELIGRPLSTLIAGRHGHRFRQDLWAILESEGRWRGELWSRSKSGEMLLNLVSITGIDDANGEVSYAVLFGELVSDAENAARLRFLATHDPLTGLPNRTGLSESLDIMTAQMGNRSMALMVVGLDRFKLINEAFGYTIGDDILTALGSRLMESAPPGAMVARVGSDEFAVVIGPASAPEIAQTHATTLLESIARPLEIGGEPIAVTASIGIAFHPEAGGSPETLLNNARLAMREAKRAGSNRHKIFNGEKSVSTRHKLSVESALRYAIERGELEVHYQPKIAIETMTVIGMEALARWRHPVLGPIAPTEFIPIAEDAGLISRIGEWVLETACAQTQIWQTGLQPLRVAVNLSGLQVQDTSLRRKVASILDRTGLAPECLEIEITESVAMGDADFNLSQLQDLADLGIRLAIDDFGTGYSSFAYLRRFPIHLLKIDRSFVMGIETDDRAATIPYAIISMAHDLGLAVVAEGIETERQLKALSAAGCDEGQGYYFSKAMPAPAFEAYCRGSLITGMPYSLPQLCAE